MWPSPWRCGTSSLRARTSISLSLSRSCQGTLSQTCGPATWGSSPSLEPTPSELTPGAAGLFFFLTPQRRRNALSGYSSTSWIMCRSMSDLFLMRRSARSPGLQATSRATRRTRLGQKSDSRTRWQTSLRQALAPAPASTVSGGEPARLSARSSTPALPPLLGAPCRARRRTKSPLRLPRWRAGTGLPQSGDDPGSWQPLRPSH